MVVEHHLVLALGARGCTDESSGMRSWDILSDLSGFHGNIIRLQDISKTEGSLSRREGPDD